MALLPLPIDPHLGDIVARLRADGALVIVAEPGAGKTTRVPRALLDAGLAREGEIVVLEPRRLAVRMAARRVASELGERAGERVGYQVRFEDQTSKQTRVRFLTEGILTRRIADDPELRGVSVLVLDELHERHLHSDLALAFARRARAQARPDLHVVVMSATLDAEKVAGFLGCGVARVPGRTFPVEIEHLDAPDERPLDQLVAVALKRLLARGLEGDVLVFLPGAGEIRRAREALAPIAEREGLALEMLHGDLSAAEQDRAVRPGDRRKVILSTNVAESSVTIEGVVAVIDSGLARVARSSPWTGLPTLELAKVSRASATQRAGRAGRTRPGTCLRLYTKHDHDARPDHDAPEIARVDLAETVLLLLCLGEDPRAFPFFEAPGAASIDAAESLLEKLGALGAGGRVTALGRRMTSFPVHPRLARLLFEAEARGVASQGCLLAAIVGEREPRLSVRTRFDGREAKTDEVGASDLLARRDAFEAAEHDGLSQRALRANDLDPAATHAIARARDQLLAALRPSREADRTHDPAEEEEALLVATLAAFPDRVGRRREPTSDAIVFSGGGSARLAPTSVVKEASFLVAVDVDDRRRGGAMIRAASAIEPEWLLELFPERIEEKDALRFDATREWVERARGIFFEGLALDESRGRAEPSPEASAVLAEAVLAAGLGAVCDAEAIETLARRCRFASAYDERIPTLDAGTSRALLEKLCEGSVSFADLRAQKLELLLPHSFPTGAKEALDRLAPERITLPGRPRGLEVHYELDRPPWIESRMQDFFGMEDGPRIAGGAVPLVLHLLAPNQRAVQVTTDLRGFWDRHWPTIRKELSRRYPRHRWPENPRKV
jgi:ATP-dependent helicase HrpB